MSHYLRSAEIVFSLSNIAQVKSEKKLNNETELYGKMLEARRNLALFQHHDAITGTSKPDVVKDYADKYDYEFQAFFFLIRDNYEGSTKR